MKGVLQELCRAFVPLSKKSPHRRALFFEAPSKGACVAKKMSDQLT
jgi:hypothetical protein